MEIIVYLLGFGHIFFSSLCILYTRESVDWIQDMFKAYPLKYLAAMPLVYGLLFLVSASSTCFPWLFRLIGLLGFIEAVVAFTNPEKIYSRMLDWYFENISIRTNQLFGILGVILGTLIITWAK